MLGINLCIIFVTLDPCNKINAFTISGDTYTSLFNVDECRLSAVMLHKGTAGGTDREPGRISYLFQCRPSPSPGPAPPAIIELLV